MLKTRSLKEYWKTVYKVTVKRDKERITREGARELMAHFCNFVVEEVLKGKEVYLPKIGTFAIKGTKVNYSELSNKAIDWASTLKMWKEDPDLKPQLVYFLNEHTNGYYYGLKWKKTKHSLTKAYGHRATKHFRRKLHKKIVNEKAEYLHT